MKCLVVLSKQETHCWVRISDSKIQSCQIVDASLKRKGRLDVAGN